MGLGRPEERTLAKTGVLIFCLSAVLNLAMAYVQNRVVSESLEDRVRDLADILAACAVPLLLVTGSLVWAKSTRKTAEVWRNGLASSAIVIASMVWAAYVANKVPLLRAHEPACCLSLEWLSTLLLSSVLALLHGFAFRGSARFIIFSAALLLYAGLRSGIYF